MRVYAPSTATVSGLNATGWDANLVPAGAFAFDIAADTGVGDALAGYILMCGVF